MTRKRKNQLLSEGNYELDTTEIEFGPKIGQIGSYNTDLDPEEQRIQAGECLESAKRSMMRRRKNQLLSETKL